MTRNILKNSTLENNNHSNIVLENITLAHSPSNMLYQGSYTHKPEFDQALINWNMSRGHIRIQLYREIRHKKILSSLMGSSFLAKEKYLKNILMDRKIDRN